MTEDGKLLGIDTLLYAFDGSSGQGVKQHLTLSKESEFNLSSCGRVRQAVKDGDCSIHVACEATTWMISEIRFEGSHVHVRKAAHERLTASEQEQYESLTGPLRVSPFGASRVSGGREQVATDEETGDSGNTCSWDQSFQVPRTNTVGPRLVFRMGSFAGNWDIS